MPGWYQARVPHGTSHVNGLEKKSDLNLKKGKRHVPGTIQERTRHARPGIVEFLFPDSTVPGGIRHRRCASIGTTSHRNPCTVVVLIFVSSNPPKPLQWKCTVFLRSSYPTHHLPSQLTRSRPGRALLSLPNSDPRLLTRHPFHLSHRRPDFFSLDVNADYDLDPSRQPSTATHPSPPEPERALECGWFRASSRFRSPMLQLHKEIIDFCEFLSPTSEEELSRSSAVEGVFNVIKYIWPHRKVEVFGSFKTGLYLPSSDIDVVILDSRVKTSQVGLLALSKALSQRGIAKKIQVIAKARVPIVKFIERTSGVAFDISFDVENGPKAAEFIKYAGTKIPPLRPLCLILKVFLQQRELNEVYTGGIGSYTLLSMLIAHLQDRKLNLLLLVNKGLDSLKLLESDLEDLEGHNCKNC